MSHIAGLYKFDRIVNPNCVVQKPRSSAANEWTNQFHLNSLDIELKLGLIIIKFVKVVGINSALNPNL